MVSSHQVRSAILPSIDTTKLTRGSLVAILLQLGMGIGLSVGTMIIFSILRRKNGIVYMPRRPPELGNGFFSGLRSVIQTTEAELLKNIGLDGVIFLRLLKICRWTCGLLTLLACIILIPCDLFYNLHFNQSRYDPKSNNPQSSYQPLGENALWLVNVVTIDGNWLYAHLLYGYLATFIVLYMIYVNYKLVISLKWKWFRSPEYQSSILARSIMLTHIDRRYLLDERLEQLFAKLPIKCTAVYFGRRVGILPYLIQRHNENVRQLEKVLASYLKVNSPSKRPTIRVRDGLPCMWGGKEDAIEFFTQKILHFKREIQKERHYISRYEPESYAFASFPTVAHAHMVAKELDTKKIDGVSISLAPDPQEIVWENLTKSHKKIFFQRTLAQVLIVFFGILYTIPLAPIVWLSILFLDPTAIVNSASKPQYKFLVILGVVPPLLTLFSQWAPLTVFRKLGRFKGAFTQQQLERAVFSGYFSFLAAFQFLVFSALGFLWYLIALERDEPKLKSPFRKMGIILEIYLIESNYWMTWFPLKIFTRAVDVVQIVSLISSVRFKLWKNRRTPREIRELTKPSEFDYSVHMANVLFMLLVAMIYAPLAPLVTLIATAVFYANSWIYKYQLIYLSTTKCETGGKIWQLFINRMLLSLIVMLIFLCLTIGVQLGRVQSLAALPPIGMVIAFKCFIKFKFESSFKWYIPTGHELTQLQRHEDDTQKDQLVKKFGHPLLHEELLTPIVHRDQEANLARAYLDSQVGLGTDQNVEEAEDSTTRLVVQNEMDYLEGGTSNATLTFKAELSKEHQVQHGGLAFFLVSKNDLTYTHGEFICQRDRDEKYTPFVPTKRLQSNHPTLNTLINPTWLLPLHVFPVGYAKSSHELPNNTRNDNQASTQGALE